MNAINSLPESGNWCQVSPSSWLRRLRRNSKYAAICAMLAANFPAVAQPAPKKSINRSHLLAMLLWAGFTSSALAQTNCACVDTNQCANSDAGFYYPTNLLTYPLISDQ
jgi:hypothetical protein